MEIPQQYIRGFYRTTVTLLFILSVFFAVKALAALRSYGEGNSDTNTITLSGHGEVQAAPDIATIDFTVQASQMTQSASSDQVNTKMKKILDFLASAGVASKDIQTNNYSSYPTYSDSRPVNPCYVNSNYPCAMEQKIVGYAVSQSVDVKIRKIDDTSKIIDGINAIGVTNMSGPSMTIDNEDGLKTEAREKAIDDAKAQAKELAKELGVSLGSITSFSESGNYPIYYAKGAMAMDSVAPTAAPAQIPQGQNTITSDVTVTYHIR